MLGKTELCAVLNEWSYWDKDPPPSVQRNPIGFPPSVPPDLVLVIQGVRRSGKSTFLSQIPTRLGIPSNRCTFANFEDPRLVNALSTELLEHILQIATERADGDEPTFLFLDEIQNVPAWEKWLHLKVAHPTNVRYVVTGSNASLLSGDLATALTGRHLTVEIFPFSYEESQKVQRGNLASHLANGGFPRALSFTPTAQLLREYFADIVGKDVRRHVAARDNLVLQRFFQIVFESVGSEVSLRKLAAALDITADTAGQYVAAGMSAYLVFECPFFTYSEKKRAVRNRKLYSIDTGLRNAVVSRAGRDIGKNFENMVYLMLRRHTKRIFFWRGKGEVDFVVPTVEGIQPIQVSYEHSKARHEKAVEEFREMHQNTREPLLVTSQTLDELNKWIEGAEFS